MASSKPSVTRTLIKNKPLLIFANIYFVLVSSFITLMVLPLGYALLLFNKLFPETVTGKTLRHYSYCYGRLFCFVNRPFLPIDIMNKDEANQHKPCIIIANHQSALDLFLFGAQTCTNFSYFVKSWPFKLFFFFAPLMRASEYINVEELNPEEIERQCLNLLNSGTSLVIFPEGKRTKTGDLGRFHTGAFRLACSANVPIVPLIFENTYAVFPAYSKFIYPQRIKIKMLQAIFPKDFIASDLPHRDMMRFAHKQYVAFFNNI